MKRVFLALGLMLAGCSDDALVPAEMVPEVDAPTNDGWSFKTKEDLNRFLGTMDTQGLKRIRVESVIDAGVPLTTVTGALANEQAEIGIGTIEGHVGEVVSIFVSIVGDDHLEDADGIQAFGLDLIFPTDMVELVGGRMASDLVDRGWYMGGHNQIVLNGQLYVRCGAFAGSGAGVYADEAVNLYELSFKILAGGGESQAIVWKAFDHIGWYTSDAPMPFFDSRSHIWGCWRIDNENGIGIHHPITYGEVGQRHVAHVYAAQAWTQNGPFGDFSLDVRYPLSSDFIYSEAGINTEHFESVTVTEVEPGLLRVVGILGAGVPDPEAYNWGQIVRLDFVPHAVGVLEHWELLNFGGDLEGGTTSCEW